MAAQCYSIFCLFDFTTDVLHGIFHFHVYYLTFILSRISQVYSELRFDSKAIMRMVMTLHHLEHRSFPI